MAEDGGRFAADHDRALEVAASAAYERWSLGQHGHVLSWEKVTQEEKAIWRAAIEAGIDAWWEVPIPQAFLDMMNGRRS